MQVSGSVDFMSHVNMRILYRNGKCALAGEKPWRSKEAQALNPRGTYRKEEQMKQKSLQAQRKHLCYRDLRSLSSLSLKTALLFNSHSNIDPHSTFTLRSTFFMLLQHQCELRNSPLVWRLDAQGHGGDSGEGHKLHMRHSFDL